MNEKDAPVDLFLKVLKRLDRAHVLANIVLIGSWCMLFYRDLFKGKALLSPLRTRDLDLLVPRRPKIGAPVDVPNLLKDLSFILDLHRKGYMRNKMWCVRGRRAQFVTASTIANWASVFPN